MASSAPPPGAWSQWSNDVKHPVDWFSWGADLRVRNEYFANALSLTPASAINYQDYFRFRGRIWASAVPVTNVSVNARLTAEPREWIDPSYARQFGIGRTGLEWRYGILDNLNVKWVEALDQPLTITVGRQDVSFGEAGNWWLVADGTPFDGSWTFFFDSARAVYDAKQIKTRFDVAYLYQNANPGRWLPTLGQSWDNTVNGAQTPYYLTEQNEQGGVVYVSNHSLDKAQIDGYFIIKNDNAVSLIPNGDSADIFTLGSKVSGTPAAHWAYSAEAAYQFGQKQDPTVNPPYTTSPTAWRHLSAYGGNGYLTYLFKDSMNNQISLAGEYLSGDKPGTTGTDEMFDILWGRWPRFSEMSVYSYVYETSRKVCQLNNLGRLGPSWTVSPLKNLNFKATYNALFAPEAIPTRAQAPVFSNAGDFRGHYAQAILKYQFNKNLCGHLWGEFQWQGNYYQQQCLMTFLRAEATLTF